MDLETIATQFIEAARRGDLTTVKNMVSSGIDPSTKDANGTSALHVAAVGGQLEVVKFLVATGADLNPGCCTPIHWACDGGHLEIVKFLASSGADLSAFCGQEVLHHAVGNGNLEIVKFLTSFEAVDLSSRNEVGCTPLNLAVQEGLTEIAKWLLSKDADFFFPDMYVGTPLHYAAARRNREIAERLIEKGADFGILNRFNMTAYEVAKGACVDIMKNLKQSFELQISFACHK
eukprot:TRINITY_DN1301_c0_g1_i2.p1 TRINITY_DN1301_c0_g1~~TRINITY_DN1301_c0_g1_i2.p1  ORF type:complete len:233 (-),score=28.95 TRINITY_DN1301_c0_g1_i2:383-1081(-)